MFSIFTESLDNTNQLGEAIGSLLKAGDIVLLSGGLGSGKTTITQSIAKAMGIEDEVSSPTFTLIKEYTDTKIPLYHFDLYRLENEQELDSLGYEEYLYGEGVTVIEWADYLDYHLPEEYLLIQIAQGTENRENREFEFTPVGSRYEELIEELKCYEYSFR